MNIRCVNCNEKTISLWKGFINKGKVACPSCKSNLKLEPNRASRPLALLNMLLIILIVGKIENESLNSFLGYIIIITITLIATFFTTKSTVTNLPPSKKDKM